MHTFFSKHGDIVDMNLDYYPEMVIVTYTKHADVLKIVEAKTLAYHYD